MGDIIIRQTVPDDIPEIAAIEAESFPDPWTEDLLLSELSRTMGIFLSAKNGDGKIVGYIIGTQDGESAFIDNVAAAASARRHGVGTALMKAFFEQLPVTVKHAALEVRASNIAARELYSRFGFKTTGIRPNLYSSPQENGFVMTLELKED